MNAALALRIEPDPARELAFLRFKLAERDHTIAALTLDIARLRAERAALMGGPKAGCIPRDRAKPKPVDDGIPPNPNGGKRNCAWMRGLLRGRGPMTLAQLLEESGKSQVSVYMALSVNGRWIIKGRVPRSAKRTYTLRDSAPA